MKLKERWAAFDIWLAAKMVERLCIALVGTGFVTFGLCMVIGAYLGGLIGFAVGAVIGYFALLASINMAAAVVECCDR